MQLNTPVGRFQVSLMFHSNVIAREKLPATMLENTDTSCEEPISDGGGSNSMPPPVPAAVLFVIVLLKMWT